MLLTISVTVIAVIMVIDVCVLIWIGLHIRRSVRETEKLLETVRMEIVPLAHEFTVISHQAKGILESIHRQVEDMEEGISAFKNTAVGLKGLQARIQERIENPLLQLAALAGAVSQGLRTFFRTSSR